MFDDEKENRLIAKAQAGDSTAMEELLNKYNPAIKAAVRKVSPFINVQDAIQTARLTFIEMVLNHDPAKGHLTGRVKYEIQHALQEESTLNSSPWHIPARTQRRFLTIMRKADNDVLRGADLAEEHGMARSTFLMISNIKDSTFSADANPEWLEIMYENTAIVDLETSVLAQQALSCLDGTETYVVKAFYGFTGFREMTDSEIAFGLGKSKRQIRSIRVNALNKMRKELAVIAA